MDEKIPEFSTKMMQQYMEIKKRYQDCIIFFRLGDFYEMFLDDAKIGAEILGITYTSRSRGKDGRIPMAGIPYHAVDSYLAKMVKAGYKVAICEQLTQPGGKDIVLRDVVRVVTPGTLMDDRVIDKKDNSFVMSIIREQKNFGLAYADVTTGVMYANEVGDEAELLNEITRVNPKECILDGNLFGDKNFVKMLNAISDFQIYKNTNDNGKETADYAKYICKHFNIKSIEGIGLDSKKLATHAACILLEYIKYTQNGRIPHIKHIKVVSLDFVELDRSTILNLELLHTIRGNERVGSLLHLLDRTKTAMGARMLRQWIVKPLLDRSHIEMRLDVVKYYIDHRNEREKLREEMREVLDIERLISKIAVGLGNPRDTLNLGISMSKALNILGKISGNPFTEKLGINTKPNVEILVRMILDTIVEEPPIDPKQGGVVKKNIDKKLDALNNTIETSKEWIANLEKAEKERTKITTLKVRYNKIFGYYIEISKSYAHLVPKEYMRKQTLVNGERFITPELKAKEEIILGTELKLCEIEYRIFNELIERIILETSQIQGLAQSIAKLDCLLTFSEIATNENYVRPTINVGTEIYVKDGRHPVVETLLENKQFVPNDTLCDTAKNQLTVITGPNMAGKSVYIRQVALITLLAQIGSYVPAESASIGAVDKIFVRSGASDIITAGLSTFMVEMVETANILNNATEKSLIVMDEIGRGTSTYDGISIACAIAEYIISDIHAKTLFATHYHELEQLEKKHPDCVKNMQVAVSHDNGDPIFLHKVIPGGAEHSFGIHVAKLAGVPSKVINKATEILHALEERN